MLDLFEGKYDVNLPFVSEAGASLQNQNIKCILNLLCRIFQGKDVNYDNFVILIDRSKDFTLYKKIL